MDLSVESVAALAAMAVGILFCSARHRLGITLDAGMAGVPGVAAIALAVGALIGAINGFLVVRLKMNAFIVTLASYIWVRGLVRGDLGRPLGPGSRAARCAGHRHRAPARHCR